jgi:hypothetical protein
MLLFVGVRIDPPPESLEVLAMSVLNATEFAPLLNGYSITVRPKKAITIPQASQLSDLQDITITGTLLPKQLVSLDQQTNARTVRGTGKPYRPEANDGDLHFCLGFAEGEPHIACELQNAKSWIKTFNDAVGEQITVAGFLRCLFEHPGFRKNDDAHIFEIHPVRAVTIGGQVLPFDVDVPDQDSIHTWAKPFPLNNQDSRIQVEYDKQNDTLVFSGMDGRDENYVIESGAVSKIALNSSTAQPAQFIFDSDDIGHRIQVYCMKGTSAVKQLGAVNEGDTITMVALRNIDLRQALKGTYAICLLAIDIQQASGATARKGRMVTRKRPSRKR